MAIRTIGTNATTSLSGLFWSPGYGSGLATADLATAAAGIKNDLVNGNPIIPFSISPEGQLYVPNRGYLKVLPGDFVCWDTTTGWPILVSKLAAGSGPWTHT